MTNGRGKFTGDAQCSLAISVGQHFDPNRRPILRLIVGPPIDSTMLMLSIMRFPVLLLLLLLSIERATERPNILFIMTDDHAAHTMSCYGSKVNETL